MKNNDSINDLLLDKNENSSSLSLGKLIVLGILLTVSAGSIIYYFINLNKDKNSEIIVEPDKQASSIINKNNPFSLLEKEDSKRGLDKKLIENLTKQREEEKKVEALKEKKKKEQINSTNIIRKNDTKDEVDNTPVNNNNPVDIRSMMNSNKNIQKDKVKEKTIKKIVKIPNKKLKYVLQSGYYAQVGAFYQTTPKSNFLSTIIQKGYNYEFYAVKINGKQVNKVVIGPFETRNDVKQELNNIKTIEKNAFILRVN
jgi:DedD protein